MPRKAKLILLFYRSWAAAGILSTAVGVVTLARTSLVMLPVVLLFKAAVAALVWYRMREYGARKIYYFTNLGVSPRSLWRWSMALDFTIFALFTATAATYNILAA